VCSPVVGERDEADDAVHEEADAGDEMADVYADDADD